jgi:molybdenum ABC transporter molybdate-binding protein
VFLSADDTRPAKLVEDGLAVPDSRFTYAIGKLVLCSKSRDFVKGEETLESGTFAKLSICNPIAAPYGAAAVAAMKSLSFTRLHGRSWSKARPSSRPFDPFLSVTSPNRRDRRPNAPAG